MINGRTIIALLLILILGGPVIYRSFVLVDYAIRRDEIIALYCVNKDKPKMACNGACHLRKKLQEPTPQAAPQLPARPTWEGSKELVFIPQCFDNTQALVPASADNQSFAEFTHCVLDGYSREILHPPATHSLI